MINDHVRDNGLVVMTTDCDLVVICSQEPTSYAEANQLFGGSPAGFRLGSKATPSITLGDGTVDGRRAILAAIADGTVEATGGGSGMWWACLDTSNSRLLSTGELTNDQVVTEGNTFTLAETTVAAFRD